MKIFAIAGTLIVFYFCWAYAMDVQRDEVQSREKIPAGHIASLSTETHWYGDTSTLTLDDGTNLRLSGTFNPWKAGDALTRTVPLKDGKPDAGENYWCLGETCLKQK